VLQRAAMRCASSGRVAVLLVVTSALTAPAQSKGSYDVFEYVAPKGWKVEKSEQWLVFKKDDGTHFANTFVIKARASAGSVRADFDADWKTHAQKHGLAKPQDTQAASEGGWDALVGSGMADGFFVTVTTLTGRGITWAVVNYFNDESLTDEMQAIADAVTVNEAKLAALQPKAASPTAPPPTPTTPAPSSGPPAGMVMTKFNTTFDDGWTATVKADWVQATKGGLEVRLFYPNDALENARPRTVDVPEYFWSKLVEPAFRTSSAKKWEGVQYPVIYFMEGPGVDKQTGASRYLALKVVFAGRAHPVLVSAPDEASFRAAYGHPNELDRLLGLNKFAVTLKDVVGTWARGGGGGVEYYNAYTGSYAGMAAISTTDEFTFKTDGSYSSTHRSANTANGATRFGGEDFKGRVTVTDWSITATNRVGGKPKRFLAHLEAVKNGYLLHLTLPTVTTSPCTTCSSARGREAPRAALGFATVAALSMLSGINNPMPGPQGGTDNLGPRVPALVGRFDELTGDVDMVDLTNPAYDCRVTLLEAD